MTEGGELEVSGRKVARRSRGNLGGERIMAAANGIALKSAATSQCWWYL